MKKLYDNNNDNRLISIIYNPIITHKKNYMIIVVKNIKIICNEEKESPGTTSVWQLLQDFIQDNLVFKRNTFSSFSKLMSQIVQQNIIGGIRL